MPRPILSSLLSMFALATAIPVHAQSICPGNPNAIGVSRTVEIDTTGGPGFGFEHFKQHDFLRSKEVVLTFDDGPWTGNTPTVLRALEEHCTRATFFMIGKHAEYYPELVRQVARAGHTIGSHTYSHADLSKKSLADAKAEIDKGIAALRQALGTDPAPFFRFPALQHPLALVSHLGDRDIGIFSTDINSYDFKFKRPGDLVESVIAKLKKADKGIVLLHDFLPNTADATRALLDQLKAEGFKIVHMRAKGAPAIPVAQPLPPPPPAVKPLDAQKPQVAAHSHGSEAQTPIVSALPQLPAAARIPIGRRVALVIGNSSYSSTGPLANPTRDAEAVANSLRQIGFGSVQLEKDLTRDRLIQALRNFADEADKADWALVYFAGHGIEMNGVDYLVPIDAKLKRDRDVQDEAAPLDRVLSAIEGAKKLRLVILDACRDNPFVAQMQRTNASRSVGRGLARIEPEGGTLIAFAAKHGQIALDGDANNSPFVMSLLKHLGTPNIEINKLFRLVRDDVLNLTNKAQEPFVYGSLPSDDFFFVQR